MTHWLDYLGIHEIILYLAIALLVSALGGGPLLKALFNWALKILGHGTSETIVTINQPGGEMAKKPALQECEGCGLLVDPTKCILHQSEHDRSMRNEAEYSKLWEFYGKLKDEMVAGQAQLRKETTAGFNEVRNENQKSFRDTQQAIFDSQRIILDALAGTRVGFGKIGRGGGNSK